MLEAEWKLEQYIVRTVKMFVLGNILSLSVFDKPLLYKLIYEFYVAVWFRKLSLELNYAEQNNEKCMHKLAINE